MPSFQLLSQQEVETSLESDLVREKLNIIPGDFGLSMNVVLNNVEADEDLSNRFSTQAKKAQKKTVSGGQVSAFLETLGDTDIPRNAHGDDLVPVHTRKVIGAASGSEQMIQSLPTTYFNVAIKRSSIYVWGKYCKYKRGLSQSPWYVDGHREGESSVEELIAAPFAEKADSSASNHVSCDAASYKFHSAGREDIDVRMLGTGRPFVIELLGTLELCDHARRFSQITPLHTQNLSMYDICVQQIL